MFVGDPENAVRREEVATTLWVFSNVFVCMCVCVCVCHVYRWKSL